MKDFKYLDVINLPSDVSGSLGKFRTGLLRAYNSNRNSAKKLELLRATLAMVIQYIEDGSDEPSTEVCQKHIVENEIANTSPTEGFEPIKQRAAKRTPTKRAKRTKQDK